ncbi:MAG: hypothetical protein M3552_22600, partial [Planctomycetota bacterium]|nr:hypothetical protein [Planctomycetota bacterium]
FETVSRLTASTESRLQAISFFTVVLLFAALFVKLLWNGVQNDFPQLPRMRFLTALKAVVLWGLACVVVLTMIAGARELMTPGAWVKKGATYKLSADERSGEKPSAIDRRLSRLGEIRSRLMNYHWDHDYKFPDSLDAIFADERDIEVPGYPGLRYVYVAGSNESGIVVYEPEVDPEHRFALTEAGNILNMTTEELEAALASKKGGS